MKDIDGNELILAMLRGGRVGGLPTREEMFVGTILGVAIGALTDLGRTDEQILKLCKATLMKIRAALGDDKAIEALRKFQETLR